MTEPIKARRKIPTDVIAIQFDGSAASYYACREFIGNPKADKTDPESSLYVTTYLGKEEVQKGHWITKDEYGRFLVHNDGSYDYQYEPKTP